MEGRKNRSLGGVLFYYILLCFAIMAAIIAGKATGHVKGEWIDVLILCLLVPWIIVCAASAVLVILYLFAKLKRWYRRRKADARIIRQAKAAGVWDKPKALGGRALELKAWRDFKIKRYPHEPDALLRARYMAEKAQADVNGKICTEKEARKLYGIIRKPGETDEELRARYEVAKTVAAVQQENDQKQEGERING